jgi:hypothetical protein
MLVLLLHSKPLQRYGSSLPQHFYRCIRSIPAPVGASSAFGGFNTLLFLFPCPFSLEERQDAWEGHVGIAA